jgi:hypothetical protein
MRGDIPPQHHTPSRRVQGQIFLHLRVCNVSVHEICLYACVSMCMYTQRVPNIKSLLTEGCGLEYRYPPFTDSDRFQADRATEGVAASDSRFRMKVQVVDLKRDRTLYLLF